LWCGEKEKFSLESLLNFPQYSNASLASPEKQASRGSPDTNYSENNESYCLMIHHPDQMDPEMDVDSFLSSAKNARRRHRSCCGAPQIKNSDECAWRLPACLSSGFCWVLRIYRVAG